MNSSEAWAFLAKVWRKPIEEDDTVFVQIAGRASYGLCSSMTWLFRAGLIKTRTYDAMERRMYQYRKSEFHYFWPCTLEGASERVQFCEEMSKRTKRK